MELFGDHYRSIYLKGLGGEKPEHPVAWDALEQAAEEAMSEASADYIYATAGTGDTYLSNREAFARRRIVPRMLRDVSERDLTVELFGETYPAPVLLAPIGVQTAAHPDGERATARAAATIGLPMIVSTAADTSMEDISEAAPGAPRWFQLYWPSDDELAAQLRRPGRERRLRSDRRHRRQLRPGLEAARPPARRAALHQGRRRRPVLLRPGLPLAAGEAARGRPRGRGRPVPRGLRQPVADLARPRQAPLLDLAADPAQGHPAPRRRPRGARARRRRDRRLQPRRPPGRRRDRLARRAAGDRHGRPRR